MSIAEAVLDALETTNLKPPPRITFED
jgi:hypothetical protein